MLKFSSKFDHSFRSFFFSLSANDDVHSVYYNDVLFFNLCISLFRQFWCVYFYSHLFLFVLVSLKVMSFYYLFVIGYFSLFCMCLPVFLSLIMPCLFLSLSGVMADNQLNSFSLFLHTSYSSSPSPFPPFFSSSADPHILTSKPHVHL